MSIWDDPEIATGDFVKFAKVGDKVSGVLTGISKSRFGDNGRATLELQLRDDDGELFTVTAPARLKAELVRLRPNVGDHIEIEMTGFEQTKARNPAMLFSVTVN